VSQGLITALRPIQHILSDPETEDLAIQEPGVGWWLKGGAWHRTELPAMTYTRLHGLSVMAAAQTGQRITARDPILSADLPGGLRLQSVMPPAVAPGTMALTFRRGDTSVADVADVPRMFDTGRWNQWNKREEAQRTLDAALLERYDAGDLPGFMQGLAETRMTGLFTGATGSGKTTLSKILSALIPLHERIITIEDAAEMQLPQQNCVRHFYAASGAGVSQADILKATLRERPDRVMLAEMRDVEGANLFLHSITMGHPGSYSTLHSRNAPEAARRLFNLVKSSAAGQASKDQAIIDMLDSAIDFIIPVENISGKRSIGEVWYRADARRRGEGMAHLMGTL